MSIGLFSFPLKLSPILYYNTVVTPRSVLLALLFTLGCAHSKGVTDHPLILTEANQDQIVSVNRGQVVTIRLSEAASTGFVWSTEPGCSLGEPRKTVEDGSKNPGAGYHVTYSWDTKRLESLGTHQLRLTKMSIRTVPPTPTSEVYLVTVQVNAVR